MKKEVTIYIENKDFKEATSFGHPEQCALALALKRKFKYPLWARLLAPIFHTSKLERDIKVGASIGFLEDKHFEVEPPFHKLEYDYLKALVEEGKEVRRETKIIFETEEQTEQG